jgi:hypothetical protein
MSSRDNYLIVASMKSLWEKFLERGFEYIFDCLNLECIDVSLSDLNLCECTSCNINSASL